MFKKLKILTTLGISAGLLVFATSSFAMGHEAEKNQSVANTDTSLLVHFPGPLRKDTKNFINKDFPAKTGYTITSYMKRSGGFSKDLLSSIKENKLNHSVVMSYGRTGELPPGRDIFEHLDNSRQLLSSKLNHLDLKPVFRHFNDPRGHLHYPFVETMVILYNPKLINKQEAPKSWHDLAKFSEQVALPGRGCYAVRALSSLYHTLGKDNFETLIINAKMPNLVTDKSDKKAIKPLKAEGVAKAIIEGKFKVGAGVITSEETLKAIADGKLGVIWPTEGAFAFPYTVAVRSNPSQAELALFNYITKDPDLQKELVRIGLSSTLSGGQVNPIVKENNFKYNFISIDTLMKKDVHQYIIDLVKKHS